MRYIFARADRPAGFVYWSGSAFRGADTLEEAIARAWDSGNGLSWIREKADVLGVAHLMYACAICALPCPLWGGEEPGNVGPTAPFRFRQACGECNPYRDSERAWIISRASGWYVTSGSGTHGPYRDRSDAWQRARDIPVSGQLTAPGSSCLNCQQTLYLHPFTGSNPQGTCWRCRARADREEASMASMSTYYGARSCVICRVETSSGCQPCERRERITRDTPGSGRLVGVEIECLLPYGSAEDNVADRISRIAECKHDSSVYHANMVGVEYALLPTRMGGRFEENIRQVCRVLREYGARTNRRCGLHVHLDMGGTTPEQRKRVLAAWQAHERLFFAMVARHRRENTYCRPSASVYSSVTNAENSGNRYAALNPTAWQRHRTYEIRLHQGSVRAHDIIGWVRLLDWFFTAAMAGAFDGRTRVPGPMRAQVAAFLKGVPLPQKRVVVKRLRRHSPAWLERIA